MRRLHLSRETYTAADLDTAAMLGRALKPEPACGASADGAAVIARGSGPGLVPLRAVSREFHCPECIAALRRP